MKIAIDFLNSLKNIEDSSLRTSGNICLYDRTKAEFYIKKLSKTKTKQKKNKESIKLLSQLANFLSEKLYSQ